MNEIPDKDRWLALLSYDLSVLMERDANGIADWIRSQTSEITRLEVALEQSINNATRLTAEVTKHEALNTLLRWDKKALRRREELFNDAIGILDNHEHCPHCDNDELFTKFRDVLVACGMDTKAANALVEQMVSDHDGHNDGD